MRFKVTNTLVHFLWDMITWFIGPYPTYIVTADVRSNFNDAPEVRYYVWCRPARFKESVIAGSTTSIGQVPEILKKWKNVNKIYQNI